MLFADQLSLASGPMSHGGGAKARIHSFLACFATMGTGCRVAADCSAVPEVWDISNLEPRIELVVYTHDAEGPVRCGMYAQEEDWLTSRYAFKATAEVQTCYAVCVFEGVPPGTYAISAYHDRNDNSAFDRDFLGLPSEDFTFSQGASAGLEPPSYEQAAFSYSGDVLRLEARM
jgi:uncharacterized protein (DUF2141 family)